jgi:transcriptional regulator with GAF, ATPase, and Fis domain
MARVREALPRVAEDRAPLLISGETGTGKEVLAAEIHRLSGRLGRLVKFNCAELSPELVESQLFGHERGAFTGATTQTTGLFAAAESGTLLLDEIAEIPLDLQPKLLRVLQGNEVLALGSTRTRRIDVRVICATNANLLERVERGTFRRDLYARLAYLELHLPPLRERRQDILLWIEDFRQRWCAERGVDRALAFRPQVAERLLLWAWPDNLRGVNRLVHRLLLADAAGPVGMSALKETLPELLAPPGASSSEPPKASSGRPLSDRPTREEFLAVYEANGHSVRATSKHFGRDRRQVYRWLEQFGIGRPNDDE